jgi:hypothetical protein
VITKVQRTEEKLTAQMTEAEHESACSSWLEGTKFRLKGEGRLKEKIADLSETSAPDATTEEIVQAIPDAIRFRRRHVRQVDVDAAVDSNLHRAAGPTLQARLSALARPQN